VDGCHVAVVGQEDDDFMEEVMKRNPSSEIGFVD